MKHGILKENIWAFENDNKVYSEAVDNLLALNKLLEYHSLNSPGVLITNFALPSKVESKEAYQSLAKLASLYLYPKKYINENFQPGEWGMDQNEWYEFVKKDFENYYGEFITRFIMDYASVFLPLICQICLMSISKRLLMYFYIKCVVTINHLI